MYKESELILELRKIREEQAKKFPSNEEYLKYLLQKQEELKKEGYKIVNLSKKKKEESSSS